MTNKPRYENAILYLTVYNGKDILYGPTALICIETAITKNGFPYPVTKEERAIHLSFIEQLQERVKIFPYHKFVISEYNPFLALSEYEACKHKYKLSEFIEDGQVNESFLTKVMQLALDDLLKQPDLPNNKQSTTSGTVPITNLPIRGKPVEHVLSISKPNTDPILQFGVDGSITWNGRKIEDGNDEEFKQAIIGFNNYLTTSLCFNRTLTTSEGKSYGQINEKAAASMVVINTDALFTTIKLFLSLEDRPYPEHDTAVLAWLLTKLGRPTDKGDL